MKPSPKEIASRTTYHPPTPEAVSAHESVRDQVNACMLAVNDLVPEGREHALAMTKLEEALFWANAGIARNHDKLT